MATAILNVGNKSFTVTDNIGTSTTKKIYALNAVETHYNSSGTGKTLSLFVGGTLAIAISDIAGSPGFGNTIFGSTTVDGAQTAVEANVGAAGGGAGAASIGDCKSGLQTADHNGWILLNGRAKTTLTTTQQAAATSLGIGANLPNATGRGFVQGALGALIGSSVITQSNLPNINLSGTTGSSGSHSHTVSSWTGSKVNVSGGSGLGVLDVAGQSSPPNVSTTAVSDHTHTVTVALGGAGSAYTPAAIGVNQFIYLAS